MSRAHSIGPFQPQLEIPALPNKKLAGLFEPQTLFLSAVLLTGRDLTQEELKLLPEPEDLKKETCQLIALALYLCNPAFVSTRQSYKPTSRKIFEELEKIQRNPRQQGTSLGWQSLSSEIQGRIKLYVQENVRALTALTSIQGARVQELRAELLEQAATQSSLELSGPDPANEWLRWELDVLESLKQSPPERAFSDVQQKLLTMSQSIGSLISALPQPEESFDLSSSMTHPLFKDSWGGMGIGMDETTRRVGVEDRNIRSKQKNRLYKYLKAALIFLALAVAAAALAYFLGAGAPVMLAIGAAFGLLFAVSASMAISSFFLKRRFADFERERIDVISRTAQSILDRIQNFQTAGSSKKHHITLLLEDHYLLYQQLTLRNPSLS